MNFEPVPSSYYRRPVATAAGASRFMLATHAWMAAGLALTGLVAFAASQSVAVTQALVQHPSLVFGLTLLEVGMVVLFSARVGRVSAPAAAGMFLAYAALNGVTLSLLLRVYTGAAVGQAFFVSAGAFAALSAYGALTKRDLGPVGQFMFVGLVGMMIAMLVNLFVHSAAIDFIVSCVGVLVFAGLTAYDNQALRRLYATTAGAGNLAIHGALMLYLDFINMFLFVLRLFGDRR